MKAFASFSVSNEHIKSNLVLSIPAKARLVGGASWYQVCGSAWCYGVAFSTVPLSNLELRLALKLLAQDDTASQ